MSFHVVQPPADEAAYNKVGVELFQASRDLGLTLDAQGFLFAWTSGTRVVVERDSEGKIIGMLLMAVGQRWIAKDFTASVMAVEGNREALLEYSRNIAAALGATSLYVEDLESETLPNGDIRRSVTEHKLQ